MRQTLCHSDANSVAREPAFAYSLFDSLNMKAAASASSVGYGGHASCSRAEPRVARSVYEGLRKESLHNQTVVRLATTPEFVHDVLRSLVSGIR